jgi:hypothetical protein
VNRLISGPRDRNSVDLSDIVRGRIVGYREIMNLKFQLEAEIKKEKEREKGA